MKNACFILFLACFSTCLSAQPRHIKLTESSIVKDSDGFVYPYNVWKILTMQGDYEVRPENEQDRKTHFLLVKLTAEQKNERFAKMPKPTESAFFRTGKAIRNLKAEDLNKNKFNLKEEKGTIIVLNFWFINCPPCKMEIPALNELVESYKGNDAVKFIAIALDEKYELQQFLKTFPFNYNIVGNGQFIAMDFGIRAYPTHVILDQDGRVYFHTTGLAANTVYWVKKSIEELLSHPVAFQR